MTHARVLTLEVLAKTKVPISALGLAELIKDSCNQATVYRALHFLESKGLVHGFVLHCSEHGTERYFVKADSVHRHWFHCECCHSFLDMGTCRLQGLQADLENEYGIHIQEHNLSFTGLCKTCSQKKVPFDHT